MTLNRSTFQLLLVLFVLTGGCATVNPRSDYHRAAEHIATAIGSSEVYSPAEQQAAAALVDELLNDGITIDEAVRICLLNNPRLQAAFLNIGISRANAVQAGLLSNPNLFASLRFPAGGGLANLDVAIAQNIAELWLIPARRLAAERALEQAILELARQAGSLGADTKSAYYRAVGADRGLQIARENRELAQLLLDVALARQQAGSGNQVDINLARSELMESELAVRRTTLKAYEERRSLASLLGLPTPPDELLLLDGLPDAPNWPLTQERLVELAEHHRLDLQAAEQTVKAAEAQFVQEQWSVVTSAELGIEMERSDRPAGSDAPQEVTTGPTISIELPLFDQNQAQIAMAQYRHEQAVKSQEGLKLEVTQEVRSAYQRGKTAWEISSFYRDSLLPLRESNLELSRDAYRAGTVALLAVLETQRALLVARAGYVEALRDAAIGFAAIENAVGLPIKTILESTAMPNPEVQP